MKNKKITFLGGILGAYLFLLGGMVLGVIDTYVTGVIISILINIILAVSLALVTGYLGELVLGHAGFMAVGAYTSAIITMNLDWPIWIKFPLAVICGGLLASVVGIIIGIPALRLRGDYLGIITLGFGEIIRIVINNLKITNGARGLSGIPGYSQFTIEIGGETVVSGIWVYFTIAFILVVITILVIYGIIKSRAGRAIIAIRENEIAADCSGISTFYYKTFAFAVAAFFAGVGGSIYAHYHQVLSPSSFGFLYSIEYLIIVVLGGMGNLLGTVVAAIVLGVLNEVLRTFSEYRMLVYSAVLITVMVCKAKGITFAYIMNKFKVPGLKKGVTYGKEE